MPIVRLKSAPKKPENLKEKTYGEYFSSLPLRGEKGEDGKTPIKGVDYFTNDEINAWLKSVTPIKGKHYFDGEKGKDSVIPGPAGRDGKDADNDLIIARVLSELPEPKAGKDGKDAEMLDLEAFKKEVMESINELKGKKLGVKDVDDLETRLNQLAAKVEKNYGGHGGTLKSITATLVSGGLYNLSSSSNPNELQVYVGGGRLFAMNGDFTQTIVGGNRVTQVNFNAIQQQNIASGAVINILGK